MLRFFIKSLFRKPRKSPAVAVFLVLGLTISCFCLSTAQGSAMREYAVLTGWEEYASITVDAGGETLRDPEGIAQWLEETYGDGLANVLYFAKDPSGVVYIGWQGTQPIRWFPLTSGRFFTKDEAGAEEIFLQDEDGEPDAGTFTLNGRELVIVGRGSFMPFHFKKGLSESSIPLLPSENDALIRILPYRLFFQMFRPVQILIHFDRLELNEAREAQKVIGEHLPGANVYLPRRDPSPLLTEKAVKGAAEGLLLCVLAGVTVLQLMLQWAELFRKELFVYHLCGLSRSRCLLVIYGQWLVWLLVGAAAGAGLHRLVFPLLRFFGADMMPRPGIYALLVGVLYALSVLCSLWPVRRMLTKDEAA